MLNINSASFKYFFAFLANQGIVLQSENQSFYGFAAPNSTFFALPINESGVISIIKYKFRFGENVECAESLTLLSKYKFAMSRAR